MSRLSFDEVYALARGAGLAPHAATVATAIAAAESSNNPAAVGDVALEDATWGPSVGLWQIRSLKAERGTGKTRDVTRLKRPAFNARSMASISNGGKNFAPWSTYTSGAYRKHLAEASAISGVVVSSDTSGGVIRGPKPSSSAAEPADWKSPLPGDHGVPGYLDDLLLGASGKAANAAAGAILTSLASQLVLAGAVALGGTLIVIGVWRTVQ